MSQDLTLVRLDIRAAKDGRHGGNEMFKAVQAMMIGKTMLEDCNLGSWALTFMLLGPQPR